MVLVGACVQGARYSFINGQGFVPRGYNSDAKLIPAIPAAASHPAIMSERQGSRKVRFSTRFRTVWPVTG